MLLQGADGGGLVIPEVHHHSLDEHVLVVRCCSLYHLLDVEMVNLMDALRYSLPEVLKHSHDQGYCAH